MLADRVRMGASSGNWLDSLPGPKELLAGDIDEGFFGEVSGQEFYDYEEITLATGMDKADPSINLKRNAGWLKFALDGKVLYVSKQTITCNHIFDNLESIGVTDGSMVVEKNNITYRVRMLNSLEKINYERTIVNEDYFKSEWNRLMLPLSPYARDQNWNWRMKPFIQEPTEYWGVSFTDKQLGIGEINGGFSVSQCGRGSLKTYRGYSGLAFAGGYRSNQRAGSFGWRPVLEVIK